MSTNPLMMPYGITELSRAVKLPWIFPWLSMGLLEISRVTLTGTTLSTLIQVMASCQMTPNTWTKVDLLSMGLGINFSEILILKKSFNVLNENLKWCMRTFTTSSTICSHNTHIGTCKHIQGSTYPLFFTCPTLKKLHFSISITSMV